MQPMIIDSLNRVSCKRCMTRELVPASRMVAVLLALGALTLEAQTIPGAVLAKSEPHHHLAYEDATIRVLRVRVDAHDTTLLHEHDPDYFWVALGNSSVINAKLGSPDATITSKDLSIHYTVGAFAHVARNPGDSPFENITVELLEPQTNVRNLCDESVPGKPLHCPTASIARGASSARPTEHRAFETDRIRVSLVTLPAGGALPLSETARRSWVIALDSADTGRGLAIDGGGSWRGGVLRLDAGSAGAIANRARTPMRILTVIDVSPRHR